MKSKVNLSAVATGTTVSTCTYSKYFYLPTKVSLLYTCLRIQEMNLNRLNNN